MDLRSDTLRNRAGKDAPQSFQTPAQFSAMALKRAVTRPQTWARTRSRFNCIAVTSIRRIEGQAPRAGGSSARLGTKKHLLAFDLGVAELRHETLNMGCDRLALLVERR